MDQGRICPKCGHQAANPGNDCPQCGVIYDRYDPAVEAAARDRSARRALLRDMPSGVRPGVASASDDTRNVVVTDVRMPFWSMVVFMVKWAIAAIPALIILMLVGAVAVGVLAGLAKPG